MPSIRSAAVRVAAALVAAASLSSTLSAAVTDTTGFVRRDSKTVTSSRATKPLGLQQNVVGVPSGPNYCLAWLDRRQGGVILATTIYGGAIAVPAGTEPGAVRLASPLGVPIATTDAPPLAILGTPGGCVVVLRRGIAVEGVLAQDETRTLFSVPDPGELVASGERYALFQSGSTLTLLNGYGATTQAGGAPAIVAASFAGERLFLVSRDGNGLTLWEASRSLQLTPVAGGIGTFPGAAVRVASSGTDVLVVSSGAPVGSTPFTMSHVSSATGVVMHQPAGTIPAAGTLRRAYFDRAYFVEWTTTDGTWVAKTDGAAIQDQYPIRSLADHLVLGPSGQTLQVWDRGTEGVTFEVGGGAMPSSEAYPITFSPQPELLVDADAGVDEVALLWYEILPLEKKQQLWFGVYAKATGALSNRLQLSDEAYDPARPPSGAVASHDRVMMIAWSDSEGLWFQRLHADGIWIDKNPRMLKARGVGLGPIEITPHGLAALDDGFLFAWTEWKDERTTGIAAAIVGGNGVAVTYPVAVTPFTAHPGRVAIAPATRGAVIAWSDLAAPLPPIDGQTSFPMTVAFYDAAFAHQQNLTPDGTLNSIQGPVLASGDRTVLMLSDRYAFLYADAELGVWGAPRVYDLSATQTRFSDRAPRSSIVWTGNEYLIATHAWRGASGPSTITTFLTSDGAFLPDALPVVPDLTLRQTLDFTPHGFLSFGRILLAGSEVFDDTEDGMVRRVRVHEFGTPVRRRSVKK